MLDIINLFCSNLLHAIFITYFPIWFMIFLGGGCLFIFICVCLCIRDKIKERNECLRETNKGR